VVDRARIDDRPAHLRPGLPALAELALAQLELSLGRRARPVVAAVVASIPIVPIPVGPIPIVAIVGHVIVIAACGDRDHQPRRKRHPRHSKHGVIDLQEARQRSSLPVRRLAPARSQKSEAQMAFTPVRLLAMMRRWICPVPSKMS
jgi:hypothetical protein